MAKDRFCKLVEEMIVDERKASKDYNKLKVRGHPVLNTTIEGIRLDEAKHAKLLEDLKRSLCRR